MSVLRLSEGGRWKEAVFWQQPRNYWSDNMTSQYQLEELKILISPIYFLNNNQWS